MNENLLLIDKPKGITSFDVIRVLRKKLSIKKMGHSGTLDPLASGLMLIGVNEGTKQLKDLIGLPKKYTTEILLGVQTETGDMEGEIIEKKPIPELDQEKIKSVLKEMEGSIDLYVPLYSAIKKEGKPLYKYAREGKKVEVPLKTMHILDATLFSFNNDTLEIEFNVKSGTYIRSIAEELGRRLGTVATVKNLRRTSIGDYSIDDAEKLDL
ncbi:tRNA pseudouridine(55) synthase TruB [Candidatus Wolfebacteria bacterium]|nr:MAG: tRNA pseudouridine(55) synthase TruB [Candidatus Wolfebacteria bacterium]